MPELWLYCRKFNGTMSAKEQLLYSMYTYSVTLNTAANRNNMPNADFNQWTPLQFVAEMVFSWTQPSRPPTGSMLSLVTSGGVTTVSPVN